ncbi:MAG: ion transporter [Candidatus Competibacterales bacterium]
MNEPNATSPSQQSRLARAIESEAFQRFIIVVIVANAVILGLETWPGAVAVAGSTLALLDHLALLVFVVELSLKLWVYRLRFFTRGWNVFDFAIVAISLAPLAGDFAVLRALRIMRALRLISVVPQMRVVIQALLAALPGMGAIMLLLTLFFYVASVMATKLFAAAFPEWFGSLGASMYTLFQIMTLESWSMGIVRPVMGVYPWAWVFFVPFIIIASFAVLNLFIGLIVNSLSIIQSQQADESSDPRSTEPNDGNLQALVAEVQALRREVAMLHSALGQQHQSPIPAQDAGAPKLHPLDGR